MKRNFKYYKYNNKYLFSYFDYNLEEASEDELMDSNNIIYFLNQLNRERSRSSFSPSSPSHLVLEEENINILNRDETSLDLPSWISNRISKRKIKSINTLYPGWKSRLNEESKKKWKLNLIALGDVGSTLSIGLRLLGHDTISEVGLYDRNKDRLNRWLHELNQVVDPSGTLDFPSFLPIEEKDLFDCDMFVFCASKGIPPLDSQVGDVRMAQFESNSSIIKEYGRLAKERDFQGIFAVVSDPVDLLCKVLLLESGLRPEQIIGYGLGVMNARALFYANEYGIESYKNEGRVFGPHGQGLIVANSIDKYNEKDSDLLTDKTLNANKVVRGFGFKPFVAPSLSSGALSLISTIRGDWFYGSTFIHKVYMGSRCRLNPSGLEVEQVKLPKELFKKIQETYDKLEKII